MTNFSHPQQKDQSYCSNYTSTPKLKACFRNESSRHVEKAMAPHSSALAWKVPWTEEPGGLKSMGSWRVRHDWATSLSLFTFHFHALEKEMATHSSVLAWRIPGTGEPGVLPPMGSHRVRHDWNDLAAAAAAACIHLPLNTWVAKYVTNQGQVINSILVILMVFLLLVILKGAIILDMLTLSPPASPPAPCSWAVVSGRC